MTPDQQHQWNLEIFRSLVETGKSAQNALLLVAGGSATALLSFVGVLSDKPGRDALVAALMGALGWIGCSLLVTVLMSGCSYVAQGFYKRSTYIASDVIEMKPTAARAAWEQERDRLERWGDRYSKVVAMAFAVATCCLGFGGYGAIRAGQTAAAPPIAARLQIVAPAPRHNLPAVPSNLTAPTSAGRPPLQPSNSR